MTSVPANLGSLIPADAALDPSKWNIAVLSPVAQRFDQNFALRLDEHHRHRRGRRTPSGSATTGGVNNQLTLNYGIRWDADPNTASPPDVTDQLDSDQSWLLGRRMRAASPIRLQDRHPRLEGHRAARRLHLQRRRQERLRHPRRHRPLLRVAGVERDVQPAVYSNLITATLREQRPVRADFIANPTNGVTAEDFFAGKRRRPSSRRASSSRTSRIRTPGRAASASRSRSTP